LAGFISVLVFQQGAQAILNAVGFIPNAPFPASRTWPLGAPQIWSWAFWGGVWGLVYGFFEKWFPEKFFSYWIVAILFGAIFPTLVLWFVVFPLKGVPVAAPRSGLRGAGSSRAVKRRTCASSSMIRACRNRSGAR
jgi:hypothetical protein